HAIDIVVGRPFDMSCARLFEQFQENLRGLVAFTDIWTKLQPALKRLARQAELHPIVAYGTAALPEPDLALLVPRKIDHHGSFDGFYYNPTNSRLDLDKQLYNSAKFPQVINSEGFSHLLGGSRSRSNE